MRLYHGSTLSIPRPDVVHSRDNLDFGRGFYLTSYREQAQRWARRKAAIERRQAIVNVYEFSCDLTGIRVLEFSENDEDWVEFVCECRRGRNLSDGYDLVIGGVADDKVYEAVNMYFKGFWDMQTTLSALRFYGRNDQYCFVTQGALDRLVSFVDSYEVGNGDN